MFKNVMFLGSIQVGLAVTITIILEGIHIESTYTWPSLISSLIGAQIFAFYQLRRNEDFFIWIPQKRFSFLTGIFHVVIGLVFGLLLVYLAVQDFGGWDQAVAWVEVDLGRPVTIQLVAWFLIIVLALSYLLATAFTYLGLRLGQKMFVRQKKKS